MKLKDYIKILQQIQKKHGDNLELIYSIDDEGNWYEKVYFSPSVHYVSKQTLKDDSFDCMNIDDIPTTDKDVAVVCIN